MNFSEEEEEKKPLHAARRRSSVPIKNMDDFIKLGLIVHFERKSETPGPYCTAILLMCEILTLVALGNMVFMVFAGNIR